MKAIASVGDKELWQHIEDLNDICRASHSGSLLFGTKRRVAAESKLHRCITDSVNSVLKAKVTKQSMLAAKKTFINATLEFWEEGSSHRKATVAFWGMDTPVEASGPWVSSTGEQWDKAMNVALMEIGVATDRIPAVSVEMYVSKSVREERPEISSDVWTNFSKAREKALGMVTGK
eukprot:10430451-Lingulodinium_polyedra.AAC.1